MRLERRYPGRGTGWSQRVGNLVENTIECALEGLVDRFRSSLKGQRGLSNNTVRVYIADLKPFVQFLEKEGLEPVHLNRQLLRRYLAWLSTSARGEQRGYDRVSVARKLVVLRSFYRFLAQEGVVPFNPVPKGRSFNIKVKKRLPVFLGKDEAMKLMAAPDLSTPIGMRDAAILELLYSTGLRLSELGNLDISDISIDAHEVKARGKGSKDRIVLLGKPAMKSLDSYLNNARPYLLSNNASALFLNRYGGRLSLRSIEKIVGKYAAKAATRPGVHTHTLRHTFATHMLEGGADLRVVQQLLGHSTPATTQIYTHVTQNETRAEYMTTHPRARPEKRDG